MNRVKTQISSLAHRVDGAVRSGLRGDPKSAAQSKAKYGVAGPFVDTLRNGPKSTARLRLFLGLTIGAIVSPSAVWSADEPATGLGHGLSPQPQLEDRRFPQLPFKGQGELFEIPPGYERPIEVNEGKLIPIRRFVISGIDNYPEIAKHHQAIAEILQKEKDRLIQENFVEERWKRDDIDFFSLDYNLPADDSKSETESESTEGEEDESVVKYGMTIGQIQQTANLAAAYLRDQGYFLTQGVLPDQTVVDGEVNILFLPGVLGEVRVENNVWYSSRQLKQPYQDLVNEPVYRKSLEKGILNMQKTPGLKSYATLVRGTSVGTTDLLIRTQDEDRHKFSMGLSNNNLDLTGAYLFQFDYTLNNPFRVSDAFFLSLRSSFAPAQNQFYSLSYDLPLSDATSLFFNFFGVDYRVDSTDVVVEEIVGSTRNFTTRFDWQMVTSRYFNLSFSTAFDRSSLLVDSGSGAVIQTAEISALSFSLALDWVEIGGSSLNTAELIVGRGLPDFLGSNDTETDQGAASFDRLTGEPDYTYYQLRYQRLQSINTNNSILFKLRYQYTDDILYSVHNSSIGGPDSFRALPSSSLLRDSAFIGTAEYILSPFSSRKFNDRLTWGQVIQFSLYADYAASSRNTSELSPSTPEDPDQANLTSVGLSGQFTIPDVFKLRFDYAFLIYNSASPGLDRVTSELISEYVYGDSSESQPTSQFFFSATYFF